MRQWQAVAFDLDDTLYPERAYVASGMCAVAAWAEERLGRPRSECFSELCRLFEEGERRNVFDIWLSSHDLDPRQWVPAMVEAYRGHEPKIAPYPHAESLLERFRESCKLGLVTDGRPRVQQGKLTALGLEPFFEAIVFSGELGRDAWKPSTKPFRRLLELLSVDAEKAVYVGDNPAKDFLGARRLGMGTVRVRHPDGLHYRLEPPSPEHAPDMEVATLADLTGILSASEA